MTLNLSDEMAATLKQACLESRAQCEKDLSYAKDLTVARSQRYAEKALRNAERLQARIDDLNAAIEMLEAR